MARTEELSATFPVYPARRKRSEGGLCGHALLGTVLHPLDQQRSRAIRAREALGDIRLVTTHEVLTALLDGLAQRGTHLREAAGQAVRTSSPIPESTTITLMFPGIAFLLCGVQATTSCR